MRSEDTDVLAARDTPPPDIPDSGNAFVSSTVTTVYGPFFISATEILKMPSGLLKNHLLWIYYPIILG